jgi:hypothetical protein
VDGNYHTFCVDVNGMLWNYVERIDKQKPGLPGLLILMWNVVELDGKYIGGSGDSHNIRLKALLLLDFKNFTIFIYHTSYHTHEKTRMS